MATFMENVKTVGRRINCWMDAHPRTGWYVALVSSLNVLLNLANLFVH